MTALIKPAIHSYLLATADEREPDYLWHPSSLFMCDRQAVYQVRATPETDFKTGEDMIPLAMGKAIHTIIQSAVTYGSGCDVARLDEGDWCRTHQFFLDDGHPPKTPIKQAWHEVKVLIPGLKVTGSADSLVLLDDGTYEVEEFKSTKSSGIMWANRAAKKSGGPGFQPKPNHVSQGLAYVYAMRHFPFYVENEPAPPIRFEPLGDRLTKLRVTYFGKDAGEILEFVYTITPDWEAQFEKYIEDLERYRSPDAPLPPRLARDDDGKKNWLCGYCQWRSRCWDDDGEGVEL